MEKLKLNKKNRPLRDEAYKTLKSAIIEGDISPGERLIENKLAKGLGISRTPIREALRRLEQEKIIVLCSNRGFRTNESSNKKIEEIFGIRTVLEGYAGSLATDYISESQLRILEMNIQETEHYYKYWNPRKLFRLNTIFHEIIIANSHSEILQQLLSALRDQVQIYRMAMLYTPENFCNSIEHHKKIVNALKMRNSVQVEMSIRDHIIEAKEILKAQWKGSPHSAKGEVSLYGK